MPSADKSNAFPFPTTEDHSAKPMGDIRPVVEDPSEDAIDNGVQESFPASDPVSVTVTVSKAVPVSGKPNSKRKTHQPPRMSPVNIDQARAVGQDGPEEGSAMGREADKASGFPGDEEMRKSETKSVDPGSADRQEAVRRAAYDAYLRRGGSPGSELDDWLAGEESVDRHTRQP